MFICKPLFSPYMRIYGFCIARYTMIAHENKNGIGEPGFFFSCFYEFLKTIIRIPECIELLQ